MKKLVLTSVLLLSLFTFAQVPQGISYQAIALNGSGNPVVSANVGLRLSILDNTASGTVLYTETQVKTTNNKGLFNLVIGQGTATSGTFAGINWKVNSKFLKVEMDAAGGTNYVLVGTTQLLSVPYALAADSLVMSNGEAITLVSPNGTPYQLTVNDSGQLSLPTSGVSGTVANSMYLYGSYNSFDPFGASLMPIDTYWGSKFYGYKYFAAGTQLKFLTSNNSASPVYGLNGGLALTLNGSAYTVATSGFYYVELKDGTAPFNITDYVFYMSNGVPSIDVQGQSIATIPSTYNVATNTISYTVNGVTNSSTGFYFDIHTPYGSGSYPFADQFNDGTIDAATNTPIPFPGVTATPKNFRIDLVLNFNGSGTYTITQLP